MATVGYSIKHLEFIQSAISRMADSSAAIKRHAIVVALAVLASAQVLHQAPLLVAGMAMTVVFAMLDASYLRNEKGFRSLYDEVRMKPNTETVDFRMEPLTGEHAFVRVLLSWSIIWLYLSLLFIQAVALFPLVLKQ